ncbi:hypothetical protein T552_02541 [Pneumocystis carinii B80]|uniref:NADH-ubiquinone oxidoreductase 21kDa subunit N-terminal domain-containing protein n=1 Tax=Pneumocystis carinii (strain B80) TaxID=1408658 RepID=A0A0W4ZFB9_PNEC8|nr:hypothetical protein T552_02541 [Pneumocystis carinii B80]KTW27049.1 hypothetical protein T552_02541 [Pneumocystis carinii B80]
MVSAKKLRTEFPVIDTDPHFFRVIRYARPSDYLTFIIGTAGFPISMLVLEKLYPSLNKSGLGPALRLSGVLGICGGFLLAYQRSSLRLWGWTENGREVQMNKEEVERKRAANEPLYGKSEMPEDMQRIAAQNSRYSALKFSAFPWFNFVNHNEHNTDSSKYQD